MKTFPLIPVIACAFLSFFAQTAPAAVTHPITQATAYYSQGGFPVSNVLDLANNGNAWAGDENGVLNTYMKTSMGPHIDWIAQTESIDSLNNLAVFNLENTVPLTGDGNTYLWISLRNNTQWVDHAVANFRVYVTDENTNNFGSGEANVWTQYYRDAPNKDDLQSLITGKLGAANIWQPLKNYHSTVGTPDAISEANGIITNRTPSSGDKDYTLTVLPPAGMTSMTGLKLELYIEETSPGVPFGPGTANHRNFVLSQLYVATVGAVMVSDKTTPIGYSSYNQAYIDVIKNFRPVADFRANPSTIPFMDFGVQRGGFGYDFGGFRTVDGFSFYEEIYSGGNAYQRAGIKEAMIYTSQGEFLVKNIPMPDADGMVYIDLPKGIDTSYIFIKPTAQYSRAEYDALNGSPVPNYETNVGIANFDVATRGNFVEWTNLALGKTVTRDESKPRQGDNYWVQSLANNPNIESVLTDGKMSLGLGGGNFGSNGELEQCWFFDSGTATIGTSWFQIDLEKSEWINTIGLFQQNSGRKTLQEMKLEFWNGSEAYPTDPDEIITYILSIHPGENDFQLYDSMYQQVLFDDVFAQYLRLTPTEYSNSNQHWGLAELQLFYNPTANDDGVPEPATWAMMLIGLAAVGVYQRR